MVIIHGFRRECGVKVLEEHLDEKKRQCGFSVETGWCFSIYLHRVLRIGELRRFMLFLISVPIRSEHFVALRWRLNSYKAIIIGFIMFSSFINGKKLYIDTTCTYVYVYKSY